MTDPNSNALPNDPPVPAASNPSPFPPPAWADDGRKLAARLAALALAPATILAGLLAAPRMVVSDGVADVLAIVLSVVPALVALSLASRRPLPSVRALVVLAALALAALVVVSLVGLRSAVIPLQVGALVALGHALGTLVGARVAHPGHLLPAAIVASAADLASVISPEGPSHAIAQSEAAMTVAALSAPVPGTLAVTHVLGVGDLVMLGLFFAAAARFDIPAGRVALGAALGLVVAFALSAWLATPIPALVPMGFAVVLVVPRFRQLAPADRRATLTAAVLAAALIAAVLVRARAG